MVPSGLRAYAGRRDQPSVLRHPDQERLRLWRAAVVVRWHHGVDHMPAVGKLLDSTVEHSRGYSAVQPLPARNSSTA